MNDDKFLFIGCRDHLLRYLQYFYMKNYNVYFDKNELYDLIDILENIEEMSDKGTPINCPNAGIINIQESEECFGSDEPESEYRVRLITSFKGKKYFINVKKTVIALLPLLVDIYATKGAATMMATLSGLITKTFHELSDEEYGILLKLKKLRKNKSCVKTEDLQKYLNTNVIQQKLNDLLSKGIIEKTRNGCLKIPF